MQSEEIRSEILKMWKPRDEYTWIYLETGEVHNEFERKGIIQKLLDQQQIENFHDCDDLYT